MFARIYIVAFLVLMTGTLSAGESNEARMKELLDNQARAKNILSFLHFGSDYVGHRFNGKGGVVNAQGKTIPDAFYLEYTYDWKAGGAKGTTVASFFFNKNGQFSHVQIDKTDAQINQPFAFANISIALVGGLVSEGLKDSLTENQKASLDKMIQNADAKAILEFFLVVDLAGRK